MAVLKNGTYAILAIKLLHANPSLGKTGLWREIQSAVHNEICESPAKSDQSSMTLAFQLWHFGLIVDAPV